MSGTRCPDQAITHRVNIKLANRGLRSPCRAAVQTQNGEVTLSGSIQYAHQIGAAVDAAAGITGVSRVVDQLTVTPLVKR